MKRDLPMATLVANPGVQFALSPNALSRWMPDVQLAAKEEEENVISILDVIGANWWGEGVTLKRVMGALRAIGKKDVVVHVNSPGGDYFEGLAIYNALREHPGKVTVKIFGLAASAASVIAMAGDEVLIGRAAFLMIHNTWIVTMGDRHVHREAASWLEPFDSAAADIYAARSGQDVKSIAKQLDRETWIGGSDAIEQGFADDLLSADQVTKAKASAEAKAVAAAHRLEQLLSRLDVPRSERRALIADLKGGMPGAALTVMPGADVAAGLAGLLEKMRSA